MDLVKIGFLIKADGLDKANKDVDGLLDKIDTLNKRKVNIGGGSGTPKAVTQYQAISTAADKMLEKQKTLSQLLPYMDKQTANLAAGFWMVSKEANQFNAFLDMIANNKALDTQRKEAEATAKALANADNEKEAARLKEMKARQEEYDKNMALMEKERQANMAAVQKQYQADMDAAAKATKDKADMEEAARVKRFKAEQAEYHRNMEQMAKARKAEEDAIQKTNKLRQDEYQKTMAAAKAAQDKEIKAAKALNDQWNTSVQLQEKIAKYQQQGMSYGNATKMAKMEISGADIATLDQYAKALGEVEKSTTKTSNSQIKGIIQYALLSAAIYGAMSATMALLGATVRMADEYTSIQNRMKLYIDDANELAKVNANLAQFAMANNVGLRETSTLFARLQPAMQKIGANTAAVISVVDAFGKSMRIGGATAAEAASATLQFSQAMASGKLAGDEFRSISEASPRFLKAIADGSGIAASRLKEMSSAGMLTTEVISKALLKEYPKLIEENKRLGATLEQGANAITTAFTVMIGEFNEGAGITKTVGAAMMNLGQSMFKAGQSAKETGAAISKWFGDNATIIGYVVDAVQLLAITWASRYVASIGLSLAATLRQNAALVASNGLMQTLGVTALRTGMAMQTAFAFFGGWAGILTTIATVAATYLLLRDNTAQATGKIVEQSKYVDMSAESFKKLNDEQQKNVQASLGEDIAKANEQLDKQANTVNRVLLSYAQFAQMQGKALNSDVTDVINQTVKGLMDYDTAYRKLLELGVPKNVLEDFKKQKDVYDETASSSLKLEAAAKAAGVGIKLGGNEAQNAQPSVRGLASAVDDLGDASVRAANKFKDLVTAYASEVVSLQKQTALMASSGLDAQLAGRVIKESNDLAERNEKIADGTTAIENYKTAVSKLGAEEQKQHQATIKALEAKVKKGQESLAAFYAKGLTPSAQALQAAQDAQSKLVEARNKAERDANKKQKETRTKKTDENYLPEQIEQQIRLIELLEQGKSLEVARTASTKEYVKWYGSNLAMAEHYADVMEEVAKASNRANAAKALKDQQNDYANIVKFMAQGYSYAVAQKAVQADFTTDAKGIAQANNLVAASLRDQLATKLDEVNTQQDIQDFVKSGLSLEEAKAKVAIYRNKNLNSELVTLSAQVSEMERAAQWEVSRTNMLLQRNTLQKESLYLTATEDNEIASIMAQYEGISAEEAKSLKAQQDIVKTLKDHNDQLKKNKSLAGALETVNFDAFGDFGNPFKAALEGLNNLVFGMDEVKDKYAEMFKRNEDAQTKATKGSDEYTALVKQRADLELSYIEEKEKATDQALSSGLSMAKSMFAENSKGYKLMSTLEQAYQAKKIAFALWEKKDEIAMLALKLKAHVTDALGFTTGAAAKLAAQSAVNVAKGTEAVLSQGSGDPYTAFGRMAAMAAIVAGLGIAIGSIGGGGSGTAPTSNQGTGTVFGGAVDDKSESIVKAMETLAENSDLGLPISSAMLASLRNIESSLSGVANLIIRGDVGGALAASVDGSTSLGMLGDTATKYASKIASAFFLGVDKMLGFDVGGLVGGVVGSVIGGIFGKKSSTVTGQGLVASKQSLGSVLDNGIKLSEYADIKTTKKSWFSSSTSYSTKYSDADQGIKDQFNLIFANMYDSILGASDILGKDLNGVSAKLRSYVISLGKIDVKGLSGTEIQEKLEAVFGAEADKIAKYAVGGLEDFQQIGEGYFETLVRVASGIESAQYYTNRLNVGLVDYANIVNKQGDVAVELVRQSILVAEGSKHVENGFYDLVATFDGTVDDLYGFVLSLRELQDAIVATGKNGDYLTSTMILAAGGAGTLSDGLDAYFDMLSAQEQATELTRRMTKAFATLGQQLPSDIEAYKALVASIDISSDAGQKLYGQIIALAPEFTELQDAIADANSEVNALVQSLRDLADQARSSRGDTNQPSNLAYLRNEFNTQSALAMQGDVEASEKLLSLSKSLLTLSKQYSVDGSEYARDLALIQRAATVSADMQEAGLGYTTPTLKPLINTSETVIQTSNTTTDAKLEVLREDLITAITAVAKYTQDTAARLERWDYGDRMNVRVEQDVDDIPVPVKIIP